GRELVGVGNGRAVVRTVRHPVVVHVRIAGVSVGVGIGVRLVGVGDQRAVVAGIAVPVAVGIRLGDVAHRRAVVEHIEHGVGVGVRTGIRAGMQVRTIGARAVLTQGRLVAGLRRAGDYVVE